MRTFSGVTIGVIGDVMVDRYIEGEVHRISSEAPVPIVLCKKEQLRMGGAANVANNIVAMGGRCYLWGSIGDDKYGKWLDNELKKRGIEADLVLGTPGDTILKTRVVGEGKQIVRFDREVVEQHYFAPQHFRPIDKGICDFVIVSDYGKGYLHKDMLTFLSHRLAKKIKGYLIDIYPDHMSWYKEQVGPIVIANVRKAKQVGIANLIDFASALVVTRGPKGMFVFEREGEKWVRDRVEGYIVEVSDCTGAGDTAIAALSLALAKDYQIIEAAKFANWVAADVVSKFGTAVPSEERVEAWVPKKQ